MNARARNSQAEATLNHPCAAQVLDASEAVNEAIAAARDAADGDGDAMEAVGTILTADREAGRRTCAVAVASVQLRGACDRAAQATLRCARHATEAAAKITQAHEDLARRAQETKKDADLAYDDDDDDDDDDDGDDEDKDDAAAEAPPKKEPPADETMAQKVDRLTRDAHVLLDRLTTGCAKLRAELLPRCPPSAGQKQALLALCAAALDRTICDAAHRFHKSRDVTLALDEATEWIFSETPADSESTPDALDARVFVVCALHDPAACRSLCGALAPRLVTAVRNADGAPDAAARKCDAILAHADRVRARFPLPPASDS